jgi:hypothetical protein
VSERPKPSLLYVLATLILLEGLALAAATIYLVVEILVAPTASIPSAIALALVSAIATSGLVVVGISTLRARPWIRGAAICWQVLQLLLAYSILQANSPGIAWLLAVPAAIIVVLIFTPPVARALARTEA